MDPGKVAEGMGLKEAAYMGLLALFVETSMSDLDGLQIAIEGKNLDLAKGAIHSLKGAAGSLGLETIHEIALKVEHGYLDLQELHFTREGSFSGIRKMTLGQDDISFELEQEGNLTKVRFGKLLKLDEGDELVISPD